MKHSAVDKAQKKIALLKINLYKFQKEVQDVQGFQINTVKLSDGTVAMDYLFDNIFTDMFVQSKIRESEKSLQQANVELIKLWIRYCRSASTHSNSWKGNRQPMSACAGNL